MALGKSLRLTGPSISSAQGNGRSTSRAQDEAECGEQGAVGGWPWSCEFCAGNGSIPLGAPRHCFPGCQERVANRKPKLQKLCKRQAGGGLVHRMSLGVSLQDLSLSATK